mgnify:CR=1 FL=1
MENEIIKQILDRYENAIATYVKHKDRIERHENELRASNMIIQSLKAEMEVLKCKLESIKTKIK